MIVDETPFHPVDHTWPDQPGDTGTCGEAIVIDTAMAASGPDGQVMIGRQIPVRRGEPEWQWFVAHHLSGSSAAPEVGSTVDLEVDAERRRTLSASHTACHLAALAMNAATADLWRKSVQEDSLGRPDLDRIAMQSSVMDVDGSTDIYRLGKSLRKKGFDTAGLGDRLGQVADEVQRTLSRWVGSGASASIDDGGDRRVSAPRHWTCELPDGAVRLACGGTHLRDVGELTSVNVDYSLDPAGTALTVRTTPALG